MLSGTGTITDDDAPPVLSIGSPSVAEGNSGTADLAFVVTLTGSTSRQVTVAYKDSGTGTATSGTDYTAVTAGTLTFAAGDSGEDGDGDGHRRHGRRAARGRWCCVCRRRRTRRSRAE